MTTARHTSKLPEKVESAGRENLPVLRIRNIREYYAYPGIFCWLLDVLYRTLFQIGNIATALAIALRQAVLLYRSRRKDFKLSSRLTPPVYMPEEEFADALDILKKERKIEWT